MLAALIVTASAFVSLTKCETELARQEISSIRAFYLTEAGIEEAIYRFKEGNYGNFSGSLYAGAGVREYNVTISGSSPTYNVISTGFYPNATAGIKVTRKVQVSITVIPNGQPGNVTNAIAVNGTLSVGGAVDICGTTQQNANVSFQSIFGLTKEEVHAKAAHNYTDPPNNQMPVDNITWVNLVNNNDFKISTEGWVGSGILVVNKTTGSTGISLEITGGNFTGIIWVVGNLKIAGNAKITGAILVEDGSAEVTKLTGNPEITYSLPDINSSLAGLGGVMGNVTSWREIR